MASPLLIARSALHDALQPGRYGACESSQTPGVEISERLGLRILHIAARKDRAADTIAALADATGVAAVDASESAKAPGITLLGSAPGQWLALLDEGARIERLKEALSGMASLTDLSSARTVIRLSGACARQVLAKGCPIDLDPAVFAPGSAAITEVAHLVCHIWQVDETPSFDLMVNRSSANSFLAWLTASAAEFGYEIV